MSAAADTLRAAKALIDTPDKWSADGWGTDRRPCAIHALQIAGGRHAALPPSLSWAALRGACEELDPTFGGDRYPGTFNDMHSHAEVMDAFDRAIVLAEAAS